MKILVQKFGGTSVSTEEKRKHVIEKVLNAIKARIFSCGSSICHGKKR